MVSIREKGGLEIRVRETGSHRPRHSGMVFRAKKLQSVFSMRERGSRLEGKSSVPYTLCNVNGD